MAVRTLAQKLGLKPDLIACVINAPTHYADLVRDAEVHLHSNLQQSADFIHVFSKNRHEFWFLVHAGKQHMSVNGALWISWLKKASGVESELSFSVVRRCGLDAGLCV